MKSLEKPSKLGNYDGLRDSNEHIKHVDTKLNYCNFKGALKCKLFTLSPKEVEITWFKTLPNESINLGRDLCDSFASQFTIQKNQPATIIKLSRIQQKKKETLREYNDRFTKVALEAGEQTTY